jgi:saccharopine dehydrogenase (NAD+, L-lysine-forming)
MAKVICLGGCGVVGSIATKTLAAFPDFSEVVVGDINEEKSSDLIRDYPDKIRFIRINVDNTEKLGSILKEFDLVVNCIGPFYRYGPSVLKAAIQARIPYIDVNDDIDATKIVLEMDSLAKKLGITAIIGMGSSPGVTNILARFAYDQMLDKVDSIDLYHAHGGEPVEGPGVILHRIHAMTIDIPVFLNGEFKTVTFFSDDGQKLEEDVEFEKIGTYHVHPYPHPETLTLPRYISGVKRVTNKGTVLPPEYFYLITDVVKLGLTDDKPINVKGQLIKPIDFAISYIIESRKRILKETQFGKQRGCVKIVVQGEKENKSHTIVFSLASEEQALGEGTGIPVAFGAVLLQRGLIQKKGVLPPEACIEPLEFLSVLQEHMDLDSVSGGASPLTIESIDQDGKTERIYL